MYTIFKGVLALQIILCPLFSLSQKPKSKTIITLAPGITAPINYPNNFSPNRVTPCDNPDVRVFPSNLPQSEVHISINKTNPQVLLLSANTFPRFNSEQGAYWSTDGGLNWAGDDNLPNNGFARGDPSTAFDAAGRGYVATMNADNLFAPEANGYLVQRTDNNGLNWQPQVAGTAVLDNFDKEMIAADDVQLSPFTNNLYCSWSRLYNNPSNDLVQFNRSTNQGLNFDAPITLKNGWGQGTNVQTGPNGEVYVCWADYNNSTTDWTSHGVGFCRSTNGGVNFTASQRVIAYTGIRAYNSNTQNDQNPLFNNIRVNDFPAMAVDKSNGTHRGRIFVVFPAKEAGYGKAVIQTSFSDDQGNSWTNPETISIVNGRQNWFPWITVDDANGDVFVAYYSLDEAAGFNTNTYVAFSNDGGVTFVNQRVSDVNHITAPILEFGGGYAGDYIGITAFGGRAFASWMDNRTGQWQIYVSQVRDFDILGDNSVCTTTSNYTISNLPQGAAVQWQTDPQGIVTINSPNATQTTLTKNANGRISLSATITNVCGGAPVTVTKENIQVGSPSFIGTSFFSGTGSTLSTWNSFGGTGEAFVQLDGSLGYTSYNWSLYSGTVAWYNQYYLTPPGIKLYFDIGRNQPYGKQVAFRLAATNSCGTLYEVYYFYYTGINGYNVVASPNPTTGNLEISMTNSARIQEVKVTDKTGFERKHFTFSATSNAVSINISSLPPDIYYLQVFDGKQWSVKPIIKQ